MKQETKRTCIFYTVSYGIFAAFWLYQGFFEEDRVDWSRAGLGLLWLILAVAWTVRAVRACQEHPEKTTEEIHE